MPDPIIVAPYDPTWPAAFAAEESRIRAAIVLPALIEHIGSTAVPDLAAKPVIDIMIGLATLAEAPAWIDGLKNLGYEYVPKFESVMPERRYFRHFVEGRRGHQIHMVEQSSDFWTRHIAFRNFLRIHPAEALAYGQLKQHLATRFRDDREGYMDGKDAFIKNLEARALAERDGDR